MTPADDAPDPTPAAGRPLVSVVMPVLDAAATLAEAVASIRAQSLPDWELFLIDDGSRDDSPAIMAALAGADPRIRCLATAGRQGAGPARNLGIEAARGRYVAFLDADDLWHPRKLELQLAAMRREGAVLSCTAFLRHDLDRGTQTVVGVPAHATRAMLLKTNTVACSSAMFDRSHFGPRRMPALRRRQDFAFWLELLQGTPHVLGVPLVLMVYRQHAASLSAPKGRAAADTWTMYRGALGLPLPSAAWYFSHYALRGFTRHRLPRLARRVGWMQGANHPGDEL